MVQWLAYLARMVTALILAGSAALVGIMSAFGPDRSPAAFAVAGIFGVAAFFTWPRRPNAWRYDPPTDRQLAYAQDLGIAVPPGATKGEVSDMISAVKGR